MPSLGASGAVGAGGGGRGRRGHRDGKPGRRSGALAAEAAAGAFLAWDVFSARVFPDTPCGCSCSNPQPIVSCFSLKGVVYTASGWLGHVLRVCAATLT